MLKSKPSTFNPFSAISVGLKKASAELCQSSAQKQIAPIGLVAILGLTGVSWLTTSFVAPQSAQAYTARVNVALNRESGESFRSFLRRAESVARAAAQRSFDRDILVTDVAVTVVGQNDGAIAPILSLEVSRQAWRRSPDPQRWITYFPNTQSLLGFKDTPEQPGTQPMGVPQPGATPQPGVRPSPQAPAGPRVIELPGGNRRVITPTQQAPAQQAPAQQAPAQQAPAQQAPAQQAPAQQTSPNNQNTNQNNQIPNIPGAPIQRVPLPAPPNR